MKYNFDKVVDRKNTYAVKYDERVRNFGTDDLIPLWIADMDFETAQPVIEAVNKRAQHGIYGYVSKPDSYFQAFCDWQIRRNNWDINKDLVSFSPGVVPSLSVIVKEFTAEGDKVLIQTPVYPEFYDVVEAWDRTVLENQLTEENGVYSIDFEDFEEKLKMGPKLFILCNPQNPVGRVWTREELTKITDLCLKHNVLIASDEIHSDLMLWGNKHIPTATISTAVNDITITCTSCSKTFNLAGLQASFAVFPNKESKNKFDKFWRNLEIHRNNCFSLVALEAAYREGEEWLEQLIPYLEGNIEFIREYCKNNIPQIKPSKPESTYLVWLDCRDLGLNDEELKDFMINKAHLGLNAGSNFCRSLSGYMRMNVACPRSILETAMKQLEEAAKSFMTAAKISITNAVPEDLDEIAALEAVCFPPAEAATKESFKKRIQRFPESFFVAKLDGKVIGVVNGCITDSDVIYDAMFHDDNEHVSGGKNQTVFGLLVHPDFQRKGIAALLLNHLINISRERGKKAVILTCKDKLIHYYEKFGFENKGISSSSHGGAVWYDMYLKL